MAGVVVDNLVLTIACDPGPRGRVLLGYAYLLSHPGTPFVLWDHLFDWGDDYHKKIKEMIAVRSRSGITSRSKVEIKVGLMFPECSLRES